MCSKILWRRLVVLKFIKNAHNFDSWRLTFFAHEFIFFSFYDLSSVLLQFPAILRLNKHLIRHWTTYWNNVGVYLIHGFNFPSLILPETILFFFMYILSTLLFARVCKFFFNFSYFLRSWSRSSFSCPPRPLLIFLEQQTAAFSKISSSDETTLQLIATGKCRGCYRLLLQWQHYSNHYADKNSWGVICVIFPLVEREIKRWNKKWEIRKEEKR